MVAERAASTLYLPARRAASLMVWIVCLLMFTPFVESWELWTQDKRFQLRGTSPNAPVTEIVLIEIAESTLKRWEKEPTLFWGRHYADAINHTRDWGAKVIGLDFIPEITYGEFAEAANLPFDETIKAKIDTPLIDANVNAEGRLIFASLLTTDKPIVPHNELAIQVSDAPNIGFINEFPDQDEVIRHIPLYLRGDGKIEPSFDALLALRARNANPTQEQSYRALTHRIEQHAGVMACRSNFVNRSDYQGKPFRVFRLEEVANGSLSFEDRARFKNAVVIIGASYAGSKDFKRTPLSARATGIEIHGHAVYTLLNRLTVGRLVPASEFLLCLVIGACLCLLLLRLSPRAALLGIALFVPLWMIIGWAAFLFARVMLPIVCPLMAAVIPLAVFHTCRAFIETGLRERLMPYAPSALTDALMTNPIAITNEVSTEYISVLFFDLRNSTENVRFADPHDYLQEMNILFAEIQPILDKHHGTLATFTGDGFMALFGAPSRLEHHARSAFNAAREILEAVELLNERRRIEDKPPRRAGIGIDSGAPVCGNLGTPQRRTYTALGETVNIAARLEAKNKEFASVITLSAETYSRLHLSQQKHAVQRTTTINGRNEIITLYTWDENALKAFGKETS